MQVYSVRVRPIPALPSKDNDARSLLVAGMLAGCDSRALSLGLKCLEPSPGFVDTRFIGSAVHTGRPDAVRR